MKVSITNQDGIELSTELNMPPSGSANQYAIFAHCFTCSKSFSATRNISRSLIMQGFGVLRFDFTGLGNSEGEFGDSNVSANMDDIKTVAQWLTDNYKAPNLLVGHS
jgi:alpha/beta superfamily hydrolase